MVGTAKSKYIEFCGRLEHVPVFASPWFLEAASQGQWSASFSHDKKGEVQAALGYLMAKKFGAISKIGMPHLTPYLFPLFKEGKFKNYYDESNYKIKHLDAIIDEMMRVTYVNVLLHPEFSTPSAFLTKGLELSPRYTSILTNTKDHDTIWNGFRSNLRNHITNFPQNYKVSDIEDAALFYTLCEDVFSRQGEKIPYSVKQFLAIDEAVKANGNRTILVAKDGSGQSVSGLYLVYDQSVCYCLATGTIKEFRDVHPLSTLYWEAIKLSSEVTGSFNFCGSMISGIERMFRSFNGEQTLYLRASKMPSLVKILKG